MAPATHWPPPLPPAAIPRGDSNQNPPAIGLLDLLREDLATHGGDWAAQGFWALAVHRFGNWRMGVRHKLLRVPLTVMYRVANKLVEWLCGIRLPYTVRVGRRVHLWHFGGMILVAESIGDDVQIRQNTTFGLARAGEFANPIIGDRVDIGCGACILGRVAIGHDSAVGANAVVVDHVPPYSVVVGIPAQVVKSRQPTVPETSP